MKSLKKKLRLHDRPLNKANPNRNENGFMQFIDDYVAYSDLYRGI